MSDTVWLYKDTNGDWRWQRRNDSNGKIIADSSEGYEHASYCRERAEHVNGPASDELHYRDKPITAVTVTIDDPAND